MGQSTDGVGHGMRMGTGVPWDGLGTGLGQGMGCIPALQEGGLQAQPGARVSTEHEVGGLSTAGASTVALRRRSW